jgi:hypothetical protein
MIEQKTVLREAVVIKLWIAGNHAKTARNCLRAVLRACRFRPAPAIGAVVRFIAG